MKNQLFLLTLCVALFGASSCSEDDDTDASDLTTDIVGSYTNADTNTDIVVNKVDDTTVSIAGTTIGLVGQSVAFPDVDMTSATAFTMNPVTGSDCGGTVTYSGTGTASNGNISLFITIVNTGGGCDGTFTRSVSASK